MESVTALDQQQYGELLGWLNGTMVTVRKNYEEDSEQPIRNLFKELILYSPVIKEFIEYRKNKGKKVTSGILSSMHSIKVETKEEYEQRPKNEDGVIEVASDAYQQFAKRWREKTEQINKMNHENEFLELFLKTFRGLYRSSDAFDVIDVNEKKLDNFTLLCVKINQLDDLVIDQLYRTYENPKYNEWYGKYAYVPYRGGMGGRKLSRRRKSNSKSKLKRRRKSSHRRQSHRRQRH